MSDNVTINLTHCGVCVSDLERSSTFYKEVFGFQLDYTAKVFEPYDRAAELPGMQCQVAFYQLNGMTIELIGYETPDVVGSSERRPMNQRGLTHMSFRVSDLEAVVERIVKYGGAVHRQTHMKEEYGEMVFCNDPDGTRLEICQAYGTFDPFREHGAPTAQ